MGKTLAPFSQLIAYERRRWAPFKRALPKEDQAIFDRLFECAKLHIQAGVLMSRPYTYLEYNPSGGHEPRPGRGEPAWRHLYGRRLR
jgi:hypothetical protein